MDYSVAVKSSTSIGRYIVRIKTIPTCTCKDYENGFLCKHIKAVLIASYKLTHDHPFLTMRTFSQQDLSKLGINLNRCEKPLSDHEIGDLLTSGL